MALGSFVKTVSPASNFFWGGGLLQSLTSSGLNSEPVDTILTLFCYGAYDKLLGTYSNLYILNVEFLVKSDSTVSLFFILRLKIWMN